MTTATAPTTQGAQASVLLEQAERLAAEAATAMTDVVSLCTDEADDTVLAIEEAYALLGRAYNASRTARWAVKESDTAIEQMVFQVQLAEERVEFARIDAKRSDDDEPGVRLTRLAIPGGGGITVEEVDDGD